MSLVSIYIYTSPYIFKKNKIKSYHFTLILPLERIAEIPNLEQAQKSSLDAIYVGSSNMMFSSLFENLREVLKE